MAGAWMSACGGDDEGTIPPDAGQRLLDQLAQVEGAVDAGDCDRAQEAAVTFATGVSDLPPEVDGDVRDGLVDASAQLEELSADPQQCIETGATGETGTVPPPATTDATTETTTTDDTTTEPPPDDGPQDGPPDEPPGGGNGDPGGGNGNGGGGDGSGGDDDSSGGIGSDG